MHYLWHANVDGKFTKGEFDDDRDLSLDLWMGSGKRGGSGR
jgi:hypothetical protein